MAAPTPSRTTTPEYTSASTGPAGRHTDRPGCAWLDGSVTDPDRLARADTFADGRQPHRWSLTCGFPKQVVDDVIAGGLVLPRSISQARVCSTGKTTDRRTEWLRVV